MKKLILHWREHLSQFSILRSKCGNDVLLALSCSLFLAQIPTLQAAPLPATYAVPGSISLTYKVSASQFPYRVDGELIWKKVGETYEARLEISKFGLARTQTSRGMITPEGLAPVRFSDKFKNEVFAHFDKKMGKVSFSAKTPDAPLLAGAQDRLSVLVQLGSLIAGNPRAHPPATTLTVQTVGTRDADTWVFTVGALETLKLPGGDQTALHLVRNPRYPQDQKVDVWLAPALGYLPARIRITEPDGEYVDQKWSASAPLN